MSTSVELGGIFVMMLSLWLILTSLIAMLQSAEKKKYGRVLDVPDYISPDEPLFFKESPIYAWYFDNKENIRNLPKTMWKEFLYLLDDGWSVVVNLYKIVTGQNKPIIVYREVKTTTLKQKIAKPVIYEKFETTEIDDKEVIGEQTVIVNGRILTKKVYKEEVEKRPKRRRRKKDKKPRGKRRIFGLFKRR